MLLSRSPMKIKPPNSSPQKWSMIVFAFAAAASASALALAVWSRLRLRREPPCLPLEESSEISRMEGEGGPLIAVAPPAP